jgi:YHS domain-containing protein
MKNLLTILVLIVLANPTVAQEETVRKKHYNLENNVGLSGYDPVSYFVNKPVPGEKSISFTYKGVIYYFLTEKSRAIFKSNPDKYEPQYGGWCAYALAKPDPEKMEADPLTFKITNGKLYVFYNSFGVNTKKRWTKKEPNMKSTADKNWAEIIKE